MAAAGTAPSWYCYDDWYCDEPDDDEGAHPSRRTPSTNVY